MKSIGFVHFATCFSAEASRKFHPYFMPQSQLAVWSRGKGGSPNCVFSSLLNSSHTLV